MTYVINLDRSKERYEYVKENTKKLGFKVKRISAIDGKALSKQEINKKLDVKSYQQFLRRFPRLGTIGCSLSHIKIWRTFLASPFEYALVFEDDVTFDPKKLRLTINELIENNNYWDICSFYPTHSGIPLTIKHLDNNQELVVYLAEIASTGAYIINRKAALRLLEKALPIKMTVDHYFTRAWEFDLKFTGIENPRLVSQGIDDSIINKTKLLSPNDPHLLSTTEKIKFKMFKLQSYIIRFLYNLKLYYKLK